MVRSGIMAAARTNAQIAQALATLTNLVARDNDPGRDSEKRLERFMSHKPTLFTGGCNTQTRYINNSAF
ncbi:hypothetical protein A2U01_0090626 [Trifolium medium]|uniref:Uncharacterized protein n=1 Tax=Trifolium medium TaxID=97028 RepID=A0A392U994_9FABA|nr:hypothetical protein [Trifolium medium]